MTFDAGWYADPGKPGALRWWDGGRWTGTVADAPAPAPPPLPRYGEIAPVDTDAWSPVDLLVPAARTMATRALVWGIVSVVLFYALLPGVMAVVFGSLGLARAGKLAPSGGRSDERSRSLAGLIMGIASLSIAVIGFAALIVLSLVRRHQS